MSRVHEWRTLAMPCGCEWVHGWNDGQYQHIDFCPLHAAAEGMLAALEAKVGFDIYCPWCKNDAGQGHADDCERETNIAAARGKP